MISCKNCGYQNIGSTIDFKATLRIHKSDIETKDRCGILIINALMSKIDRFLQVQLIESVVGDLDLLNKLWEREKYCEK